MDLPSAQPDPSSAPKARIAFPRGLPGFPGAVRFALTPIDGGLLVMQSEDEPELRFLMLPYREDELPLRRADLDQACDQAGVPSGRAAVLLVVTRRAGANDGAGGLFVNLRAPVVVDTERRTAVQCVLPTADYPFRHPLAA